MTRIKEHIFALEEHTPIFADSKSEHIIGYIPKGTWMGVINKSGEKIQVISSQIDGWIKRNKVTTSSSLLMELSLGENKERIQYLISLSGSIAC